MKLKGFISAALTAAMVCTCVFSASALDGSNPPSNQKTINVKSGQTVTSNIYIGVKTPGSANMAGIEYYISRDTDALDYSAKTKAATALELCPNYPETLLNLYPLKDKDKTMFSLMPDSDGIDFPEKDLFASVEFDVKKSGTTTLNASINTLSFNDEDLTSALQYADIKQEILINGYALGDVDKDNRVTIADAIALQKSVVGISKLDELATSLGDVDGNSLINISDAISVQKCVVGIIEFL